MSFKITTYLDDGTAIHDICWEDNPLEAVKEAAYKIGWGCRIERASSIDDWSCEMYPPHRIKKMTISPYRVKG